MTTKRIESWSFRLAGTQGYEVWLEFDGLAGLEKGLEGFVRGWAAAKIRPRGECFVVHAQGRDFVSLMNWGPNAFTLPVPLGSFLLLRVDSDHPLLGDRTPGWILIRPSLDPNLQPERIAWVPDESLVGLENVAPQDPSLAGP